VRASLSTLRRSVGLCPKCSQPYTGVADSCQRCQSGSPEQPDALAPEQKLTAPGLETIRRSD
jgi:hypothetical protein